MYGLAGRRRQLFGATFETQTFFRRRWRTQVFLFDDNEKDYDTTTLTRRVRGVTFQQTKREVQAEEDRADRKANRRKVHGTAEQIRVVLRAVSSISAPFVARAELMSIEVRASV